MTKLLAVTKAILCLLAFSYAAPATSATTVCMVGDSVVKRGGYWRNHMAQYASFQYLGNYADNYTYLHDGVGGDTTEDVLGRWESIPVCNITILHVGGNDLAKLQRWPTDIANNVRELADKLAGRGSAVYVGTILPCNGCGVEANQAIVVTNYRIKTAVNGIYPVLDHWKAITRSGLPASDLYVDHFHPSDTGYRVLADYDLSVLVP